MNRSTNCFHASVQGGLLAIKSLSLARFYRSRLLRKLLRSRYGKAYAYALYSLVSTLSEDARERNRESLADFNEPISLSPLRESQDVRS